MPRLVRIYLLACIALAFGYLVFHAREPMRLDGGDPWTDAAVLLSIDDSPANDPVLGTRDPRVPELFYGVVGKVVGAQQITIFRLLALAFSGLAAWLMFQYARRTWDDRVALIATAFCTTSLLWLMFADSLYRAPIVHATCFLALWGAVRALETGQRRHYLAVLGGTFACLVTAPNEWLFLPLGVLFTTVAKGGFPARRGGLPVLLACVAGVGLAFLFRSPLAVSPATWHAALDHRVSATTDALLRRYTAMFSPLLWITVAWAVWRALRAASLRAAFEDGTTWMLVAALAFRFLPPPAMESATLRTQLLLPLYAFGSAILIAKLVAHARGTVRAAGLAWCIAAPVWGLWLAATQPREVLGRDDVARTNAYFAANDANSFVLSNLLADGPVLAAFGKHGWTVSPRELTASTPHALMLEMFNAAGTDYLHAIIFTTPWSRFVDRSISQALGRRMPALDGWPYLLRGKVKTVVAAYDKPLLHALEVVGAKRVLQAANFDVYRIDRATLLEAAARALPVVTKIAFDGPAVARHQLLGWGNPKADADARAPSATVTGSVECGTPMETAAKPAPNACTVVDTPRGLEVLDLRGVSRAEIMVRLDRACDQEVTVELAAPARVDLALNGHTVLTCGDPQWGTARPHVRVPRSAVRAGLNILRFSDVETDPKAGRPEVKSVVIEPRCE